MPSVKVCLWNIQNFGQNSEKYNGYDVTDRANTMRNAFVARFVHANAIDVLLIQEVSSSATAALTDLQGQLNALNAGGTQDWCFSWCGSAIARGNVDEVQQPRQVAFRTGARTEGYAVLWRNAQAARFTMIRGLYDIAAGTNGPGGAAVASPLNMSQRGRPTGETDGEFGATGGFMTHQKYPYQPRDPPPGYDLMDNWPRLSYPPTARADRLGIQWAKARRPVYVVLKLADAETLLCPVCVYHAPSKQTRASWGAYMSGLAREIYAINTVDGADAPEADDLVYVRKGVFGGDFNLSVNQDDWPGDYQYFTAPFSRSYDGGASRRAAPRENEGDNARRTTIQILGDNHRTPIDSADPNAYLKWKIDLIFYTSATGVRAERVNLLTELIDDAADGTYSDPLESVADYMDEVEDGIDDAPDDRPERLHAETGPQVRVTKRRKKKRVQVWVPIISGAWGGTFTDWDESKTQFAAGDVTDARRAAEYLHIFVSDHLPLVATVPT